MSKKKSVFQVRVRYSGGVERFYLSRGEYEKLAAANKVAAEAQVSAMHFGLTDEGLTFSCRVGRGVVSMSPLGAEED